MMDAEESVFKHQTWVRDRFNPSPSLKIKNKKINHFRTNPEFPTPNKKNCFFLYSTEKPTNFTKTEPPPPKKKRKLATNNFHQKGMGQGKRGRENPMILSPAATYPDNEK